MTIPVGTTKASEVHYAKEHQIPKRLDEETFEFELSSADVLTRDWDVSDAEARRVAAEEQLGEGVDDDEWYALHSMWFINKEASSAVLIVFRPKVVHVQ